MTPKSPSAVISDLLLQAGLENVEGAIPVLIEGYNAAIGVSQEAISDVSGAVVQPGTYENLYLSSSSGSDTMQVQVKGLDASYNEIIVTTTLTGQTAAPLLDRMLAFREMKILGNANNVGDIYISTDNAPVAGVPNASTVWGKILAGYGRSHNGIYVVPANYTAYLRRIFFQSSANQEVACELHITPPDVTHVEKQFALGVFRNSAEKVFDFPVKFPAKTILKPVATGGATSAIITFFAEFLLLSN